MSRPLSALALLFILTVVLPLAGAPLPSPAGRGSAHPFLTTDANGRLLMSWTERNGERAAVQFSIYDKGKWSAPRTIVERPDLIVNWADFPSVIAGENGVLYAQWLQKIGDAKHAYGIWMSRSRDGGRMWSTPRAVHRDRTETEHGFVSLVPMGKAAGVLWLDGRKMAGGHEAHGDMTLRFARFLESGDVKDEVVLDERTCECCATGMAMTSSGPVAVYRDRGRDEIRDISVVRLDGGKWTKPVSLHDDQWRIQGCPVNGPQIDARGEDVAVAWYSQPQNRGRVVVAFSSDAGATFADPIRVDEGKPAGRVDVLVLDNGDALVTWLEGSGDDAYVAARRVSANGKTGTLMKIAPVSAARGTGFPRIAIADGRLFVAWTDTGAQLIQIHALALP